MANNERPAMLSAQTSCEWDAPHPPVANGHLMGTDLWAPVGGHQLGVQSTATIGYLEQSQAPQQQSLGDAGMENYHRNDHALLDYPSSYANLPSILPQQQRHPLKRTLVSVYDFHTAGSSEMEDDMELQDNDLHFYQGPSSAECQQDAARYHQDSNSSDKQPQTALQMEYSLRDPSSPTAAASDPSAAHMRQADAATESHLPNSGGGPYYWSGGALALGYFMKPLTSSPCQKPNEGEPGSDIFFSADEVNFFESLMSDDDDDWHTTQ